MTYAHPVSGHPQRVQRQITLPLRKAVEIAYKSIRLRLARSLLVTSGIVLALAFLMSILAGEAMTDGMRHWSQFASTSPRFCELDAERGMLEAKTRPLENDLRVAAHHVNTAAPSTLPFDAKQLYGADLAELQKQVGAALPAPPGEMQAALTRDAGMQAQFSEWLKAARRLKIVRDELTGPQRLAALMQAGGVPVTSQEIAAARMQTRWLLGLALLVAFVGILNAMLMSVTERFREIGTMKCLGALDGFIVKLFLLESLFQGAVGTLIGVVLGLLLSVSSLVSSYGGFVMKDARATLPHLLADVALCFAVGVGLTVVAAVYPAWQAARMQPIEAMRVDA